MGLVEFLILCVVLGVAVWLVNTYLPLPAPIKTIILVAVVLVLVLILIRGLVGADPRDLPLRAQRHAPRALCPRGVLLAVLSDALRGRGAGRGDDRPGGRAQRDAVSELGLILTVVFGLGMLAWLIYWLFPKS
jgi:hypothetical protein